MLQYQQCLTHNTYTTACFYHTTIVVNCWSFATINLVARHQQCSVTSWTTIRHHRYSLQITWHPMSWFQQCPAVLWLLGRDGIPICHIFSKEVATINILQENGGWLTSLCGSFLVVLLQSNWSNLDIHMLHAPSVAAKNTSQPTRISWDSIWSGNG